MAQSSTSPPSDWKEKYQEAKKLQDRIQVLKAEKDCYYWLTECTKTVDDQDTRNPLKPFPERPYFRSIIDIINHEQTTFIYKSRTMMASWLVAGWAAHYGFTNPHTSVVFMGPDEVRACHDVDCVKHLWNNSIESLKQRWPIKKELGKQAYNKFEIGNGSWFLGIPGDVDKIRSLHPTIIVFDECAFFKEGEAAYNVAAATRAPKFICLSSAEMGWYDQIFKSSTPADWPEYTD